MDKDGDGVLSFEELQFFYSEQTSKLDAMGIDTLPFTDCLCQVKENLAEMMAKSSPVSNVSLFI